MEYKDCREVYFDILKVLAYFPESSSIYVDRNLLVESAECILFLLKHYKGE